MLKIKEKGLEKQLSNSEFMNDISDFPDECLACNTKLNVRQDLYDTYAAVIPYEHLLAFADKYCTMEASLKSCPQCGKLFVEMEIGDYDYIALKEVEIE